MSHIKSWLEMRVRGVVMGIQDIESSIVRRSVAADIESDIYGLDRVEFLDDDVVIDIGANVGMVSIYLAKKHPNIKILAFEPVPENFNSLMANIRFNGVDKNVFPQQLAVTDNGRVFDMIAHLPSNTGGATGFLEDMELPDHDTFEARSTTLDQIFSEWKIDRCRLLKIDCEGAEYEILYGTDLLPKVDFLSGEIHTNPMLLKEWGPPGELMQYCAKFVDPERISFHMSRMAD